MDLNCMPDDNVGNVCVEVGFLSCSVAPCYSHKKLKHHRLPVDAEDVAQDVGDFA